VAGVRGCNRLLGGLGLKILGMSNKPKGVHHEI
jgi:hypothetical protein